MKLTILLTAIIGRFCFQLIEGSFTAQNISSDANLDGRSATTGTSGVSALELGQPQNASRFVLTVT